jgi:hypothetical protein
VWLLFLFSDAMIIVVLEGGVHIRRLLKRALVGVRRWNNISVVSHFCEVFIVRLALLFYFYEF